MQMPLTVMACLSVAASAQAGPIYWTDTDDPSGSHVIRRANGDGSGIQTLLTGLRDPRPSIFKIIKCTRLSLGQIHRESSALTSMDLGQENPR